MWFNTFCAYTDNKDAFAITSACFKMKIILRNKESFFWMDNCLKLVKYALVLE